MSFVFYFTSYVLNMFRTLIYPLSGAYAVVLPRFSFCSWFAVLEIWCCWVWVVSVLQASACWSLQIEACNTDTTQTQQHEISSTQRTKNKTTNVVIQHSRMLLIVDILMSETYWVHKTWNKTASDIKLVFYSSATHRVLCLVPSKN